MYLYLYICFLTWWRGQGGKECKGGKNGIKERKRALGGREEAARAANE